MSFGVESVIEGSVARVRLSGECDLAAVAAIGECAARLAADASVTSIVVDLSQVTFIDSSGVGALVAGRRSAAGSGKSCTVIGIAGQVERVLTVMGLVAYLTGGHLDRGSSA